LALSKKEETELVAKLEEMFHSAPEHPSWREWRADIAPKCFRYREGDQWTDKERKVDTSRRSPTTKSPSRSIAWSANSSSTKSSNTRALEYRAAVGYQ